MKKIISVIQWGGGYLAEGITDNDVKAQIALVDIRGAIIPQTDISPGYFLYFGMKKEPNQYGKFPIIFLSEGKQDPESDSFADLVKDMFDDASRLKASTIYCEQPKEKKTSGGFYRYVWEYRRIKNLPCQVRPAVSSKEPQYGYTLLQEWSKQKAIIRPIYIDTIFKQQLASEDGMLEGSDLKSPEWYAFHAIRFILAGFVKNPPPAIQQMSSTGWGDKYDSENILSYQGVNKRSLSAWT